MKITGFREPFKKKILPILSITRDNKLTYYHLPGSVTITDLDIKRSYGKLKIVK